jgi:hypothetical protein
MWREQRSLAAALNEARMIRNPSFAEILDDLAAESGPEAGSRAGRFSGASGGEWAFSAFGKEKDAAEPDRRAFEAAFFPDAEDCETRAPDFDLDESRIARELGLAAATSSSDLTRARRAFALRNHPDVVDPRFRSRANERMQIANMLLDRRNKEIRAGRGSRTR